MNERIHDQQVSWQEARGSLPARPAFTSSLAPEQRVTRPKRLRTVVLCYALAGISTVAIIAVGGLTLDTVRADMLTALPDDLAADYSPGSIERAVTTLIGAAGALLLMLVIFQALSLKSFVGRRKSVARMAYVASALVTIPALALSGLFVPSIATIACGLLATAGLLVSVVVACTSRVSRWLRQSDERRRIPIAAPEEPS